MQYVINYKIRSEIFYSFYLHVATTTCKNYLILIISNSTYGFFAFLFTDNVQIRLMVNCDFLRKVAYGKDTIRKMVVHYNLQFQFPFKRGGQLFYDLVESDFGTGQ